MAEPQTHTPDPGKAPPPDPNAAEHLETESLQETDSDLWAEAMRGAAGGDREPAEPAPAAKPDDDPPLAKEEPPEEPEKPEAAAAPAEEKPEEPEDVWSGLELSDQQKADLDRMRQFERSNAGRMRAYQRELDELRRRSAGQSQPQAQDRQPDGKAGEKDGDFLTSDDWKEFADEYPEIAKPLGNVIGGLTQKATKLERELAAVGDDRRRDALTEQKELLTSEHPDWEQLVDGDAAAAFEEWLRDQPRYVQEAAARNGEGIVDAYEAADLISRYKVSKGIPLNGQTAPSGQPNGASGNPSPAPLSAKRQQQLHGAKTVRSRSPSAASGLPDPNDEEAAWRYFTKK